MSGGLDDRPARPAPRGAPIPRRRWLERCRRRGPIACGAAMLALLTTAIMSVAWPAGASSVPTTQISTTVLVPGTSVTITGLNWPVPTTFQAVLCGADEVDGTIDCAPNTAATFSAARTGRFEDQLQVVVPPRPCPCVIVLSALESSNTVRIPVEVVGAPYAPVVSQAPDRLGPTIRIKARVTGGATLGSFFGFPAPRVLYVTVTNVGRTPVQSPVVSASWGSPGGVQHVIAAPLVGPLAAGQSTVIRLPFKLDPLARGTYTVSGRYSGAPIPASFRATTSGSPAWGLLIVAVIVLQVLLLAVRNVFRRRLERRDAARRAATRALLLPVTTRGGARVGIVPGPIITVGRPSDGADAAAPGDGELPATFVPPPPPARRGDGPAELDETTVEPPPDGADGSIRWRAADASVSAAAERP